MKQIQILLVLLLISNNIYSNNSINTIRLKSNLSNEKIKAISNKIQNESTKNKYRNKDLEKNTQDKEHDIETEKKFVGSKQKKRESTIERYFNKRNNFSEDLFSPLIKDGNFTSDNEKKPEGSSQFGYDFLREAASTIKTGIYR